MVEQQKVELNFGTSPYVRNAPGESYKEEIIKIPIQGRLPILADLITGGSFHIRDFDKRIEAVPKLTTRIELPAVSVCIPTKGIHELLFLWINERCEWVNLYYNEWCESMEGGNDFVYYGPFGVDKIGSQQILQAYGLSTDSLSPDEVIKTSPEQLKN